MPCDTKRRCRPPIMRHWVLIQLDVRSICLSRHMQKAVNALQLFLSFRADPYIVPAAIFCIAAIYGCLDDVRLGKLRVRKRPLQQIDHCRAEGGRVKVRGLVVPATLSQVFDCGVLVKCFKKPAVGIVIGK